MMSKWILSLPRVVVSNSAQFQKLVGCSSYSSSSKISPGGKLAEQRLENKSDKDKVIPDEAVFYHPQHNMYVCWHPEVPFPYEMSKPIPLDAPSTDSSLKIQALVPVREAFRKKHEKVMIQELMKLTYTAKYKWMGKHGRKKKFVLKDMDPLKEKRNREYL